MTRTVTLIDADSTSHVLTVANNAQMYAGAFGLEAAPVELHVQQRAGTPGAGLSGLRDPSRTIMLPVYIKTLAKISALAEAIIGRPCRLQHDRDGTVRELLDVYYVGGLDGDDSRDVQGALWRKRIIELTALDPHWYDAVTNSNLTLPGTGTAWDAAIAWDAAVPWDGGSIINLGITTKVGAWPVFTLTGPLTAFSVTHLRTGQQIEMKLSRSLAAAQVLIIDTRPTSRTVTFQGDVDWMWLETDSDASFELKNGDTFAFISAGTTGASVVNVAYRQRWRMPS